MVIVVHHICSTGPSWLYPVVCLGHLLCLRATAIRNLRPKDSNLEVGVLNVQSLKRQKQTDKVMGEAVVAFVRKLMDEGFSVRRWKHLGVLGTCDVLNDWHWLAEHEHFLFPASRRDSRKVNQSKDVVARAIRDARKTICTPHIPDVHINRIRRHSGCHRCINDMKQHNVERDVGNNYAPVSDEGVYQSYGRLIA